MKGPATYIVLLKELWTPEMHKLRRPAVLRESALYGQPLAGALWQKHCTQQCLKASFRQFSDNWPCAYWNYASCTILCVYVDDMQMAGKKANTKKHWDAF